MRKISVSKPKFQKSSLETVTPLNPSLPFMFASQVIPVTETPNQEKSFLNEISKVNSKMVPILEKNITKDKLPNEINTVSCLPYKRRARSFSPPKDSLKIYEKDVLFFPKGVPIIPIQRYVKFEEDSELKALREEYLRLLENAQETVITESDYV